MKKDEEKNLRWKLAERPTVSNLTLLVNTGVLTKEEARKIVLDEGVVTQEEIDSVKAEQGILRKMVLELADKIGANQQIIKIIEREIPIYINHYPKWFNPYPYIQYYGDATSNIALCNATSNTAAISGFLTAVGTNASLGNALQAGGSVN